MCIQGGRAGQGLAWARHIQARVVHRVRGDYDGGNVTALAFSQLSICMGEAFGNMENEVSEGQGATEPLVGFSGIIMPFLRPRSIQQWTSGFRIDLMITLSTQHPRSNAEKVEQRLQNLDW